MHVAHRTAQECSTTVELRWVRVVTLTSGLAPFSSAAAWLL